MSEASEKRIEKLRAMAEEDPKDTFPVYAIAMELKGQGKLDEALVELRRCLELDPDYGYAFYHVAAIQRDQGKIAEAQSTVNDGIAAAERKKDEKALNELKELQEILSGGA